MVSRPVLVVMVWWVPRGSGRVHVLVLESSGLGLIKNKKRLEKIKIIILETGGPEQKNVKRQKNAERLKIDANSCQTRQHNHACSFGLGLYHLGLV
jgi:hypothetical protein